MRKETIEEVAEGYWLNDDSMSADVRMDYISGFVKGAKWQQETSYSEEEVLSFCEWFAYEIEHYNHPTNKDIVKALEQFKKK